MKEISVPLWWLQTGLATLGISLGANVLLYFIIRRAWRIDQKWNRR